MVEFRASGIEHHSEGESKVTSTTAAMTTDQYIAQVVALLPQHAHDRASIAQDIRAHIAELMAHGATESEAIERLGTPYEVAAAFADGSTPDVAGETLDRLIHDWQGGLTLQYASVSQRVAAFMIDLMLPVLALVVIVAVARLSPGVWSGGYGLFGAMILYATICVAFGWFYFPLLEWKWGQTVGKRVMRIRVKTVKGEDPRLLATFIRRIPLFMQFFVFDAVFALFTERRQRAFDIVARTVVVSDEPPVLSTSRLIAIGAVVAFCVMVVGAWYLLFTATP